MRKHPVKHRATGLADGRYTVQLEYCGYKEPRYVARFCGDWIGQDLGHASAAMLCACHNSVRTGSPIVQEIRA